MLASSVAKKGSSLSRALVYAGDGTEIMMPRAWESLPSNFDNFANAMKAQIEVVSLEAWSELVFATTDLTGIGLQPRFNNNPFNFLYFFLLLLLTVFFILQLLVAVFIDAII